MNSPWSSSQARRKERKTDGKVKKKYQSNEIPVERSKKKVKYKEKRKKNKAAAAPV
jgi:hypothetical protein